MNTRPEWYRAAREQANVVSVHERVIACERRRLGELLDRFGEPHSPCWPYRFWPRDAFEGPMRLGAVGGHGATRYRLEHYRPGEQAVFRYLAPAGYEGVHGFRIHADDEGHSRLTHFTYLKLSPYHYAMWLCCIRWVHDALVGDLLDGVERHLTGTVACRRRWKWQVHVLRRLLGGARLLTHPLLFTRNRANASSKS